MGRNPVDEPRGWGRGRSSVVCGQTLWPLPEKILFLKGSSVVLFFNFSKKGRVRPGALVALAQKKKTQNENAEIGFTRNNTKR